MVVVVDLLHSFQPTCRRLLIGAQVATLEANTYLHIFYIHKKFDVEYRIARHFCIKHGRYRLTGLFDQHIKKGFNLGIICIILKVLSCK